MNVATVRNGLVCGRCGRYVGNLSDTQYLPPIYPIAMRGEGDDEGRALLEFEWHLLGMLRQGNFSLVHPEQDGVCVSLDEWAESDDIDTDKPE